MRLDEIRDMDEEPIDEDTLDELCSPYGMSPMIPDIYAVLMLHCFRKYDERYGTNLMEGAKIPQLIPGRDSGYEEGMIWFEEITEIMDEAIYLSGWSAVWISTEMEELQEALERHRDDGEQERGFHDAYKRLMDDIFDDGFVKSCFMKEEESVMETAMYLEDGQFGIMWSEQLERYMHYRASEWDMVAAVCLEEDRCIDRLSKEVWEPYKVTYIQDMVEHEDGKYAGRKYCRIALGSDGYNCCWYDSVNPNWIFRAIKLSRMLDLAMEKIERQKKAKEGEAA